METSKEAAGVSPISGELISVGELVKGMDIEEGSLDYTTPMGLQIKARIERGAPVNVEFFHNGDKVPMPWAGSDVAKPNWHCYWIWVFDHYQHGVLLPTRVLVCRPKQ